jgi:two-component system phosphate regulon sensor histidine kinase PhoR
LLGPAKNDEKVREEFLNLMLEQAQRMQQLISDLLSLSKAEMNANTIPVGKVDILKLAEQEANNVERQADQKNMKVISNLQEDLPLARGDDKELRQIIYNLLTNAIKYGAKDSLITLSAKVTSELPPEPQMRNLSRAIIVSVQDEGEGIPPEHLSRLTERFYRVDTAHTRTIGGTGLGLSIVKHILHRHRGVLAINSTVGVGSTFSIYLPIYEDT